MDTYNESECERWSQPTPETRKELEAVYARIERAGVPQEPEGYTSETVESQCALLGAECSFRAVGRCHEGRIERRFAPTDSITGWGYGWNRDVALVRALDAVLSEGRQRGVNR